MIGYAMFGTRDLPRAATFYDALLGELGAKRAMDTEQFIMWAVSPEAPMIAICKPRDGQEATVGNGTMIALVAEGRRTRRSARRHLLRRLFPRPRRQQAQRVLHDDIEVMR